MTRAFESNPAFRLTSALLRLPLPAGPPVVLDGQTLDPHLQRMLAAMSRNPFLNPRDPSLQQRRTLVERGARTAMPLAKGIVGEDRIIDGPGGDLPVRIYRADNLAGTPPAILYLHGGGFSVGSIDSHEGLARMLARITRCAVVSVAYRLAPEHPHPAAVEDCVAAYDWLAANTAQVGARPGRVAVAGDSAGANLAAVVSMLVRDRGTTATPIAQLLLYPVTDLRMGHPSHELFAEGFYLTAADMHFYRTAYAPDWTDPTASPLLADRFDGLPPTRVWTAGFDPLRDEGEAYATAIAEAGGDVVCERAPSMIHGHFSMCMVPGGLQRTADMCRQAGSLVWEHGGL